MTDAAPSPIGPPGTLRTGLVEPVPEAEDLVGSWRLEHDPSAANGVPAHVTLRFPFRPLDHVETAIGDLRTIFGSVPRQPFRLTHPGVVWLAPEPASVFIELTERLVERFPSASPTSVRTARSSPTSPSSTTPGATARMPVPEMPSWPAPMPRCPSMPSSRR